MIIIMCAGDGKRWNNYLGVPKQLIEIDNEPLLYRTIRLLKQNGVHKNEILITMHPDIEPFNVDVGQVINYTKYEIDRFYYAKGQVIYLYGDVYYSERAIKSILSEDYMFFGRNGSSTITNKPYKELFAVKGDGDTIKQYVDKVRNLYENGQIDRCIGWNLYETYYNTKDATHIFNINDETDDFDTPEDYHNYKRI